MVEITEAYSCFLINDFQGQSRVQSATPQGNDIDFFLSTILVFGRMFGYSSKQNTKMFDLDVGLKADEEP